MVQQHQFIGHPSKDQNKHLERFLRMENTVKLNGVKPNIIKLCDIEKLCLDTGSALIVILCRDDKPFQH